MTPGSVQLRKYITARRAGASTEAAAAIASIPLGEAALWDADEERGELDWVQPWVEPAPAEIGHNSGETMMTNGMANDQLRLFIERVERLEEEKQGIADDIKDVYLEAKSQGYDPKIMKIIVRERKMDKNARDEREALLDTYRNALGMLADTPLGAAALRAA